MELRVIYGQNKFKKDATIQQLIGEFKAEFGDFAVRYLWAESVDAQNLKMELAASGLFSSKELIVLRSGEDNLELVEAILDAHSSGGGDKTVVLELESLDKRTKLYKDISKLEGFQNFENLRENELKSWALDELKSMGGEVDVEVVDEILRRSFDQYEIRNVLEQLTSLKSEGLGAVEVLDFFLPRSVNRAAYDLLELATMGRSIEAVDRLVELEKERTDPYQILSLICSQVYTLSLISSAAGKAGADKLGLHPYALSQQSKLLRMGALQEVGGLVRFVNSLYELEQKSKTLRGFDLWKGLESFLISLKFRSSSSWSA